MDVLCIVCLPRSFLTVMAAGNESDVCTTTTVYSPNAYIKDQLFHLKIGRLEHKNHNVAQIKAREINKLKHKSCCSLLC